MVGPRGTLFRYQLFNRLRHREGGLYLSQGQENLALLSESNLFSPDAATTCSGLLSRVLAHRLSHQLALSHGDPRVLWEYGNWLGVSHGLPAPSPSTLLLVALNLYQVRIARA